MVVASWTFHRYVYIGLCIYRLLMKWDKPMGKGIACDTNGFIDLSIEQSKKEGFIKPEFKLDDKARLFIKVFMDNGVITGRINNDDMHLAVFMFIHGYSCAMEALFK